MAIKKIQIPEVSVPFDIGANLSNIDDADELLKIEAVAEVSNAGGYLYRNKNTGDWTFTTGGGGGGGGVNITVSTSAPEVSQEGDFWYKILE